MILSRLQLLHGNDSVILSSKTDGPFPNNVNIIYLPPKTAHTMESVSKPSESMLVFACPVLSPCIAVAGALFLDLGPNSGNRVYLGHRYFLSNVLF